MSSRDPDRTLPGVPREEAFGPPPERRFPRQQNDPRAYIRNALAEGRFDLYCQPVLDLKDDVRFPLAEVLVRMREEENLMLPPGDFLPLMEELGIMAELDRWVVRQTVTQVVSGSPVRKFCINISLQTLRDAEFADFVQHEVRFAGITATPLVFEVCEADALHSGAARRFAQAVHDAGGGIAIEDFRCEPASFELMWALKADYLKVQGGIVRKLCTSEAAKTALRAAVQDAQAARARVIAESVEDLATLVAATRLGADYAQGFGIYRPAPIGHWLA